MSDLSSSHSQESKYANLVFVMKVVTVCLLIALAVPSNRKAFTKYVASIVTNSFFSDSAAEDTQVQVANGNLSY